MKLSANGWSHLGLRVTDLARAKRFYVDTLGCPLVRETERAVFVTVSGMLIALLGADAHTPGEDHFDPSRLAPPPKRVQKIAPCLISLLPLPSLQPLSPAKGSGALSPVQAFLFSPFC